MGQKCDEWWIDFICECFDTLHTFTLYTIEQWRRTGLMWKYHVFECWLLNCFKQCDPSYFLENFLHNLLSHFLCVWLVCKSYKFWRSALRSIRGTNIFQMWWHRGSLAGLCALNITKMTRLRVPLQCYWQWLIQSNEMPYATQNMHTITHRRFTAHCNENHWNFHVLHCVGNFRPIIPIVTCAQTIRNS